MPREKLWEFPVVVRHKRGCWCRISRRRVEEARDVLSTAPQVEICDNEISISDQTIQNCVKKSTLIRSKDETKAIQDKIEADFQPISELGLTNSVQG